MVKHGTLAGVILPFRNPRTPGRTLVTGHWHRFRWSRDDAFSGSSLYTCRCGVVRPAP